MSIINNIIEIRKKEKVVNKIVEDWNDKYSSLHLCFKITEEGKCPDSYEKCPIILKTPFGPPNCKYEISDYRGKDYKNIDLSRYDFLKLDE